MNNEPKTPNNALTSVNKVGATQAHALKSLNDGFDMQVEVIGYKARICKARYDAAIAQGFTPAEALDICTKDWSF